MCSSHQPLNGADSIEEMHPYRVLLTPEEGPSWWVTVNAYGPNDARNQAREVARDLHEDASPVKVEAC